MTKLERKNLQAEKRSGPIDITDADFNDILQKNRLVLIDFWAEFCQPCRALAPTIKRLAEEYHDRILIGKLDVEKNPRTTNRFKVFSIPTLLLFKNGKKVEEIYDDSKHGIETALDRHLGDSQTNEVRNGDAKHEKPVVVRLLRESGQ